MSPFRRNPPQFRDDFDADQPVTETLNALGHQGAWDGTIEFTGVSDIGLPDQHHDDQHHDDQVAVIRKTGHRTWDTRPVIHPVTDEPTAPFTPFRDDHDTGPMRHMPRLRKVAARPRPQRPADAALFAWSELLEQHIMLCGVCPAERRSRFADPMTARMPFAFEALRVSAHLSGWRLDGFARWACPACVGSARYWAPYGVRLWAPGAADARAVGDHNGERLRYAVMDQALLEGVREAATQGRNRAVAS